MTTITITTQAELDALPNSFDEYTYIEISNDPAIVGSIVVSKEWSNAIVRAFGNASVVAFDNANVVAYGNASVVAFDNANVVAYGNASVRAHDNASVWAYGNASVRAYGNASVRAYGNASVVAFDNANVVAYGNASVNYSDTLPYFAFWFLINKDNPGIIEAMKKQFANDPNYM